MNLREKIDRLMGDDIQLYREELINELLALFAKQMNEIIGEDEDKDDGHGGISLATMYGNAVRKEMRAKIKEVTQHE